jgi:hypothetical protein
MNTPPKKHDVSSARQRLIELMQRVNFGRIERLVIQDGQPVFDPPPRPIREIKFCSENGARPEVVIEDFTLKAQVIDLFRMLDEVRNGVIEVLEVKHGLPFRMAVEAAA